MNKLKSSFKNTLWFLIPSLLVSTYFLFLSFTNIKTVFDLFLIPNIPFFIASYILYLLLEKNFNKIVSFLISNAVAVGIWFLIIFSIRKSLEDYGMGGLLIFVTAIVALVIFLMRSIFIAGHYTTITENQIFAGVTTLPGRKVANFLIFLIGIAVLLVIFLIARSYFRII